MEKDYNEMKPTIIDAGHITGITDSGSIKIADEVVAISRVCGQEESVQRSKS
jgi:hypothetical protein